MRAKRNKHSSADWGEYFLEWRGDTSRAKASKQLVKANQKLGVRLRELKNKTTNVPDANKSALLLEEPFCSYVENFSITPAAIQKWEEGLIKEPHYLNVLLYLTLYNGDLVEDLSDYKRNLAKYSAQHALWAAKNQTPIKEDALDTPSHAKLLEIKAEPNPKIRTIQFANFLREELLVLKKNNELLEEATKLRHSIPLEGPDAWLPKLLDAENALHFANSLTYAPNTLKMSYNRHNDAQIDVYFKSAIVNYLAAEKLASKDDRRRILPFRAMAQDRWALLLAKRGLEAFNIQAGELWDEANTAFRDGFTSSPNYKFNAAWALMLDRNARYTNNLSEAESKWEKANALYVKSLEATGPEGRRSIQTMINMGWCFHNYAKRLENESRSINVDGIRSNPKALFLHDKASLLWAKSIVCYRQAIAHNKIAEASTELAESLSKYGIAEHSQALSMHICGRERKARLSLAHTLYNRSLQVSWRSETLLNAVSVLMELRCWGMAEERIRMNLNHLTFEMVQAANLPTAHTPKRLSELLNRIQKFTFDSH